MNPHNRLQTLEDAWAAEQAFLLHVRDRTNNGESLSDEEQTHLWTLYTARDVDAGPYANPTGITGDLLTQRLLAHGGTRVSGTTPFTLLLLNPELDPTEPMRLIPDRVQTWPATTKRRRMHACQCHRNSLYLYRRDPFHYRVAHGYALSDDGMWRMHSWIVRIDRPREIAVIETTEPRDLYYGVVLDADGADHLKRFIWRASQ